MIKREEIHMAAELETLIKLVGAAEIKELVRNLLLKAGGRLYELVG